MAAQLGIQVINLGGQINAGSTELITVLLTDNSGVYVSDVPLGTTAGRDSRNGYCDADDSERANAGSGGGDDGEHDDHGLFQLHLYAPDDGGARRVASEFHSDQWGGGYTGVSDPYHL